MYCRILIGHFIVTGAPLGRVASAYWVPGTTLDLLNYTDAAWTLQPGKQRDALESARITNIPGRGREHLPGSQWKSSPRAR